MSKKVALSLILCFVLTASGLMTASAEEAVNSYDFARRLMLSWLCTETPDGFPYAEMARILSDNGVDVFLSKGEKDTLTADELLEIYASLEGKAFEGDVCPIDLARVFETPEKELVTSDLNTFLSCFADCEVLTYIGLEEPLTPGDTEYTPEEPTSDIF